MQHFLRDGKAYWGGLHRELGLLIYDPRDQQRLAADKVRLYVVAERRLATFVKDARAGRAGPEPPGDVVVSPARGRDAAVAQRAGHLVQPPGRGRHLVHRQGAAHRSIKKSRSGGHNSPTAQSINHPQSNGGSML